MAAYLVRRGPEAVDALKRSALRQQARRTPEALVLCLDVSASMGTLEGTVPGMRKDGAMRQAATALVDGSRSSMVGIVTFGDRGRVECPLVHRTSALSAVAGVHAQTEGTAMRAGLRVAKGLLDPAADQYRVYRVRRIVLMSDGRATDASPELLVSDATDIWNSGIVIDTVAFGEDADRKLLEAVAAAGRGQYRTAVNARELIVTFRQLEAKRRGLLGPAEGER